jgi:hypothetical protein
MFGKKYKIIKGIEDKKGNSSFDELDIEDKEHQNGINSTQDQTFDSMELRTQK